MRKRKIMNEVLFAGILFILLWSLSRVFDPSYWFTRGKIQDRNRNYAGITAEAKDSIDVLVLGDSESYTAISPLELWQRTGISAYVCGQSGQRIPETYYILKTALQNQNPRLVILETNAIFRDLEPQKNYETALMEAFQYYFPVLRYHNLWKSFFQGRSEIENLYKGFEIRGGIVPWQGGEYLEKTEEKKDISEFVRKYLERIERLCEERGISLLLLSNPSPKNFTYKRYNAIREYAKEKGLDYLELNQKSEELKLDWETDTMDGGDHLNLSGAQKVTQYLSRYLKQHYILKDHRSEEEYQQWNVEAVRYQKQAESVLKEIRRS